MYQGAFRQVSNRETWDFTLEVTDDDGAAVDLTGAVVTIGVREPESLQPLKTWSSPSTELTHNSAGGVITFSANLEPGTFPPGQYEVGIVIRFASGLKRTLVVATLPVVDGVVTAV